MYSILFGLLLWVPLLPESQGTHPHESLHPAINGETEAEGAGDPTRRAPVVLGNEICSHRHRLPPQDIMSQI